MTGADKKWIQQKLTKWRKRLLLNEDFVLTYHDEPNDSDEDLNITYARVWYQAPTLSTPLDIYPAFADLDAVAREQILLHELVHVWIRGGEEDVTARITTTLWRAFEGKSK